MRSRAKSGTDGEEQARSSRRAALLSSRASNRRIAEAQPCFGWGNAGCRSITSRIGGPSILNRTPAPSSGRRMVQTISCRSAPWLAIRLQSKVRRTSAWTVASASSRPDRMSDISCGVADARALTRIIPPTMAKRFLTRSLTGRAPVGDAPRC